MRAEPSEFREIFRQCLKTGEILTDRRREVCPWIANRRGGNYESYRNLVQPYCGQQRG